MPKRTRLVFFLTLVIASTLLTAAYVWQAIGRSAPAPVTEAAALPPAPRPLPPTSRLYALDLSDPQRMGLVKVAALDEPNGESTTASLRCERMHFAAGVGLCLRSTLRDWLTQAVSVTLFDENFQTLHSLQIDGLPSRTRVSPDGKYAAFTVFVHGHSYAEADFSTATHILEVASGRDLGNLEAFEVWRDGKQIQAIDFNFWGVTFANDSNRFYATLSTGGVRSLVEGDLAARRMTVLYDGVECPSLSPDNRRIAFKKARGQWEWQLTILDLETMQETPLAEPGSVDDQVEWLDDATILYQQLEYDRTQNAWISVMRIPADGSGAPELFAARVGSPAVVR